MSKSRSTDRRPKAPPGSGLSFEPGRGQRDSKGNYLGEWVWRRKHPKTGKRLKRWTKQHRLSLATRVGSRFDDELREELAGIRSHDEWRVDLLPLVEEWIKEQVGEVSVATLKQRESHVRRALKRLEVRTAADLSDLSSLSRRLRALEGQRVGTSVVTRQALRRCWQNPLRMFSRWLAEDGKYLDRDPLANWKLVKAPKRVKAARRAAEPVLVAKALLALSVLDRAHNRTHPQRPFWTALLTTGARMGALIDREVHHLQEGIRLVEGLAQERAAIDLGVGRGNKRRGAARLDPTTAKELRDSLGKRKTGPLFLAPQGGPLWRERALRNWKEAYGLALVEDLCCKENLDLETAVLVNRALARRKVKVGRGGNPNRLRRSTVRARLGTQRRVAELAGRLEEDWRERMIDAHTLRKTHRTWAIASGVLPVVVDKQLGHVGVGSGEEGDLARVLAGSRLGRRCYTDLSSDLFDAGQSARAVRGLLDEALEQIEAEGSSFLLGKSGLRQASSA